MKDILYIPATAQQLQKTCKVDKVGKLHKANKLIKMMGKRDAIEGAFMRQAFKANRADAQRNSRRAKR